MARVGLQLISCSRFPYNTIQDLEFKGVNLFFELLDENNNNLEQKHGKWRLPPVVGTYSNNLLRKRKPRGQKRVGRKQKSCEKEEAQWKLRS